MEGIAAHDLAEIYAKSLLADAPPPIAEAVATWGETHPDYQNDTAMHRHALAYAELLGDLCDEFAVHTCLFEELVDHGIPGCWGTSHATLVGPRTLVVADFTYDTDVKISPEANPMLRLCALGALNTVGTEGLVDVVTIVHQPRSGGISYAIDAVDNLLALG